MRNSSQSSLLALAIALLTLPACSANDGASTPSGSMDVAAAGGTSTAAGSMGVGTTSMSAGASSTDVSDMSGATSSMGGGPTAASGATSSMGAGTSDIGVGIGGNSTQAGSGGTPAGTGGLGSGGSNAGDSGGSAPGGALTGMGGSGTGGTGGTASDSGGAAGAGGADTGGSGGGMGEPDVVVRPPVDVAGAVPAEYGNPVANPGEWIEHTYPVYYYTTQTSGLTPDDSVEKQDSPITKPCNVYTPPDYDPEIEYPLVFVLHGITNNQDSWINEGRPKPDVLLDNLITSGDIEPVIAVFPQGDSHPDYASHNDFGQTAGYMVFGDELMNDLVPFIEANYSVKTDRNYRAICGISFGGMQTVNVGLSHLLKEFAWFGSFAAAGGAYGSSQVAQNLEAQDVATYPVQHFYAMSGNNDSFGADGSVNEWEQQLPGAAPSITSENFTAHIVNGMHDYPTTTIGLYNFLRIAFGI